MSTSHTSKTTYALWAPAACAVMLACSSPVPNAVVVVPDGGRDTGGGAAAYVVKPLGCGSAGTQTVAAVSGSTVAFVSLAITTTKLAPCSIMPLGPLEMSYPFTYDICYAASDSGGAFTSKVVASAPYLAATGVGLAFDSSGNPNIAYAAQGVAPGGAPPTETCGSNAPFVISMQAGVFGAPVPVWNGSASTALIASQAAICTAEQNICGQGDAIGFYPAIGFDPKGTTFIAYRDEHFGFAMDDFGKSDVELVEGSPGAYQDLTIDVSRGGGTYNRIAFDPAGLPAVLHYNQSGQNPGLYLDSQVKSGAFTAQSGPNVWAAQQLATGQLGEQLGFAISPQGLYAVAYYNEGNSRLLYTESKDGTTWSSAAPVDLDGNTGLYPSLALDASGNPAIAYYRCNQHNTVMTCDPATDGLYLARRNGPLGSPWTTTVVQADSSVLDGTYPALAFVGGKAVIAFQEDSYDPIAKTHALTWWVAEAP